MSLDENFGQFDNVNEEDARFDNRDVIDSNQNFGPGIEVVTHKSQDYYDKLATYRYKDELGEMREVPVPQRWHPVGVFKRIIRHNKLSQYTGIIEIGMCLIGGSKVVLGDGRIVNIESLGQYHDQDINEYIQTPRCLIGDSDSNVDKAVKFYKYENQKTIEIITSSGKSVRGTYNHPMLICRNGYKKSKSARGHEWVELQNIQIGDVIESVESIPNSTGYYKNLTELQPTHYADSMIQTTKNGLVQYKTNRFGPFYSGKIPEYVTPELASLMGYVIGDGWVRENKEVGFIVAEDEIDSMPKLMGYFDETFGVKPYVERREPIDSVIGDRVVHRTMPMTQVSYYNKPVAMMLSELSQKRIPESVLCSPNNIVSKFLSWLFEADGSCLLYEYFRKDSKKKSYKGYINLTSVNIDLLRDVQIALLRFGIKGNITSKSSGAHVLDISRADDIIKFLTNIGFQSNKKREKSEKLLRHARQLSRKTTKYAYQDTVVKIIHHDEPVTVYDVSVPKTHAFITNGGLVSHNSGTGKTTLTRMFLHRLHMLGENYVVKWFTGQDLMNVDKIIKSCVVGMPHVLIFDDASYTLEDAKKEDVAKLANALTTIRHHIKSRVIVIMNIHYSKATKKFFRNQHFTFLTSVSAEEFNNYKDLFADKMHIIRAFAKLYNRLMLHGYFEVPLSSATYQNLKFQTNKPFRVGLVAEISDLHFFMYAKESCAMCDPKTDHNQLEDYHVFLKQLIDTYGESAVRTSLQYFATIYEGKNFLYPKKYSLWRHLAEAQRNVKLPLEKMLEDVKVTRKNKPASRPKKAAKIKDQSVMDLVNQVKREQEGNTMLKPPKSSFIEIPKPNKKPEGEAGAYDSLYVTRDKN